MENNLNKRIIARLDIKKNRLIKGVHLEGLRYIGEPKSFAIKYYQEGIDELLLLDSVASLHGRNALPNIIDEIKLLKSKYTVEFLEFDNSKKMNLLDFISLFTNSNLPQSTPPQAAVLAN